MIRLVLLCGLTLTLASCKASSDVQAPPTSRATAGLAEVSPPPAASLAVNPTATYHNNAPVGGEGAMLETPVPPGTANAPADPPDGAGGTTGAPDVGDLALVNNGVFVYPVPAIYAGDQVSFQVRATVPGVLSPNDVNLHILVDGQRMVDGTLGWRNLAGEAVGLFDWVWDTQGKAGDHLIQVQLDPLDKIQAGDEDPGNNQLTLPVTILPTSALGPIDREAEWLTAETECCIVHVVSGTAAHRDLNRLTDMVAEAVEQVAARLNEEPDHQLDVYLIDRVIGQGGYAGASMVISYLDRDYAGGGLHEVLAHEAVHLIDYQFAPDRIAFLAEGVAVWATGGHYKQEDLDQRVASLTKLGRYIPLEELIDNFYPAQHEIGYTEAAGLVNYLTMLYGWERVRAFYADVTADDGSSLAAAMDFNLQTHFDKSLAQTEAEWLDYLSQLPRDQTAVTDMETTLRYYDVMRRYQKLYDPTAYFLLAWLPSPEEAEEQGITADLTRHPETEVNIALETMLDAADASLRSGDYDRATVLLDSIERVLERGAFLDPLALNYFNVVHKAAELGYEAQQITLSGNEATVMATRFRGGLLAELNLLLRNQTWILSG